ncbi:MAG: threonine synthase, partial [Planctomycetota bacterium]|nr:threonine synthase [Planctomycetota bacterium]
MKRNEETAFQRCIMPSCGWTGGIREVVSKCPRCGELVDVAYEWDRMPLPSRLADFDSRAADFRNPLNFSGVWRFKPLLDFAPDSDVVTIGEGRTLLRPSRSAAVFAGVRPDCLYLQYEGLNPSGSFKDNGMTAAFTHARMTGAPTAACASTGNTSSSLAAYAAASGLMKAVVFVGSGRIAGSKLYQGLEYGARTIQIRGSFDAAMRRVIEAAGLKGIYLVNSVNPFRLEGQKTIMCRVLEGLNWDVPDWIVCPGGNLGNCSSFGKAFMELRDLGLVGRVPRLAVVNAEGARTLDIIYNDLKVRWNGGRPDGEAIAAYFRKMDAEGIEAHTIASAIEINRPVNLKKALRALEIMNGVVLSVSDQEILDAKAAVGRSGIGCEPASAAGVAGLRRLVERGVVSRSERVVCILTGHVLKSPASCIQYHTVSYTHL